MGKLDRFDIALLKKCADRRFEFAANSRQEARLYDLYRRGYLERQWETYRTNAARGTAEFRWSYRRTDAGRAAVAPSPAPETEGRDG